MNHLQASTKGSGNGLQPYVPFTSLPDGTPLPNHHGRGRQGKIMSFINKVLARFCRSPNVIIGGKEDPYLLRWHVIPRNRFFNIYLHKFLRDDDDRALHDHPWRNVSVLLKGEYIEHTPACGCSYYCKTRGEQLKLHRRSGSVVLRSATTAHRIELIEDKPVWSLFITGSKVREWGFHCLKGSVHWKVFCSPADTTVPEAGLLGRGCE